MKSLLNIIFLVILAFISLIITSCTEPSSTDEINYPKTLDREIIEKYYVYTEQGCINSSTNHPVNLHELFDARWRPFSSIEFESEVLASIYPDSVGISNLEEIPYSLNSDSVIFETMFYPLAMEGDRSEIYDYAYYYKISAYDSIYSFSSVTWGIGKLTANFIDSLRNEFLNENDTLFYKFFEIRYR